MFLSPLFIYPSCSCINFWYIFRPMLQSFCWAEDILYVFFMYPLSGICYMNIFSQCIVYLFNFLIMTRTQFLILMKSNLSCYLFSMITAFLYSVLKSFAYSKIQEVKFSPFIFHHVAFWPEFQPVKIILSLTPFFCRSECCFQFCVTCRFDKLLNVEWERSFFKCN